MQKIKILTITTDKKSEKSIQELHDKYVPDTYTCYKAKNEKEAGKLLPEIQPEIVVIELLKAKTDGISILKTVKSLCPDAKIFVYSFDDDQDTIDEYKAMGVYKYYIIPLLIDTYFHDLYVSLHLE